MDQRVIALIDLDCFYCQVEHKRLAIPQHIPLAVQQWNGLIAVNYPARRLGINRGCNINTAKTLCPDLKLVHVDTIGEGTDRRTSKVSLKRYRDASYEIMRLIERFGATMERASIDEAFIDLTEFSKDETIPCEWNGNVIGKTDKNILSVHDQCMSRGSQIIHEIRKAIFDELQFTCSAGIAQNKMIAKVISSHNKPNGQTICPSYAVSSLMNTIDVTSLRGFGGKLGKRIVQQVHMEMKNKGLSDIPKIITASMIHSEYSLQRLHEVFGEETGAWIWKRIQGNDTDPVCQRGLAKTIEAAKSFVETSEISKILKWISVLAIEIADRVNDDIQKCQRYPLHLILRIPPHSASTRFPLSKFETNSNIVYEASKKIFEDLKKRPDMRNNHVSLAASNFVEIESASQRITNYFAVPCTELKKSESTQSHQKRCERCHYVFLSEADETTHRDGHYATDLQQIEEDRVKMFHKRPKTTARTPVKRKKKQDSNNSLENYFKRRSD